MFEKLKEILIKHSENENMLITENTVLLTDLGLNSYELVDLICDVENEFDIEIPDRAIGDFKTVKNVMDFIVSNS